MSNYKFSSQIFLETIISIVTITILFLFITSIAYGQKIKSLNHLTVFDGNEKKVGDIITIGVVPLPSGNQTLGTTLAFEIDKRTFPIYVTSDFFGYI